MQPPPYFRAHAGCWRVDAPGCGVITASDAGYYHGLLFLLTTIGYRVPVTVIDLGLTAYQRRVVQAQGAELLKCPRYEGTPIAQRSSWLKPHWIAMSPYEHTLWLDADAIVCGDLSPLFERLRQSPLVMAHPYGIQAPRPCSPGVARMLGSTELPPRTDAVNAGVIGLDRGTAARSLLAKWTDLVEQCLNDDRIRAHVQYWDEGCLHLAVQQLGGTAWIVRDRPGWDRFFYMPRADAASGIWEMLPIQDGDVIMHMIGKAKPWQHWCSWVDPSKMDTPKAQRAAAREDKRISR